jgi:hypothetical protein
MKVVFNDDFIAPLSGHPDIIITDPRRWNAQKT